MDPGLTRQLKPVNKALKAVVKSQCEKEVDQKILEIGFKGQKKKKEGANFQLGVDLEKDIKELNCISCIMFLY